jgi:toxin CptA
MPARHYSSSLLDFSMSIAASAIVVPSRRLRVLVLGFALANLAAAALVGLVLRERYQAAPVSAIFFLVAALCLLHTGARRIKTLRIDVSGLGQVRLTVQQELRTKDASGEPAAMPVALLAGSTVWPHLMLLLLRSGSGALTVLPVLRDSVTPQQFRALSVALRAAGAAQEMPYPGAPTSWRAVPPLTGTHKIL